MSTEPLPVPSSPAPTVSDTGTATLREPCACGCGTRLRGRQEKFASKRCADAFYDLCRPRIASALVGAPREGSIKAIILGILHDGEWHAVAELAVAAKASESSASARVRELRGQGFRIESDLPVGCVTRPHRYRLVRG